MRYLIIALLLCSFCHLNGQSINKLSLTLGFDSGSSELKGSALALLKNVADTLKQQGITIKRIHIAGHTDKEGSAIANKRLSERRVAYVVDYLKTEGLELNGLQTTYFGEENPISEAQDEKGRALNRRVQLLVEIEDVRRPDGFGISSFTSREAESLPLVNLDQKYLQSLLSKNLQPQIFTIPIARTSTFKTQSGMVFSFPADAFANSCTDSVVITVQEYNDAPSMIKGNMTTTSDGRLLYSLGMYELEVHCVDGEKVLEPQKKYTVFVPYQQGQDSRTPRDVFAFTGQRDSLTGIVNWQQETYKRQDPMLGDWMCGSNSRKCQLFSNLFLNKRDRNAAKRANMERDKIAQRYQNVDFSTMDNLIGNELHYYVFESSQLGLTNYDVFWKLPAEKLSNQIVTLASSVTNNTEVMLYFKNRRCLVSPLEYYRDRVVFPKVPKGEEVYVIGLSVQDGEKQVQLGVKQGVTDNNPIALALEDVLSLQDLDKTLALLKSQ